MLVQCRIVDVWVSVCECTNLLSYTGEIVVMRIYVVILFY